MVDVGLLNVLVVKERTTERGHILENVVFLELLRRGNKIWTGSDRNSEVDFVCKTPTGDMEYYHVAWQMTDGFTQDRNGIRHLNVFHWLLNNKESQG